MRWVLGYAIAICLLLVIISQSIITPTFFTPFFRWQYDRLDVPTTIQIEKDELMLVTGELLDYMRGRRATLDGITAVIAGEEREFFSYIEKKHMVDVLDLYNIAFLVRNLTVIIIVALIFAMALLKMRVLYVLARCCREILTGFLILTGILAGVIAINFERAFDIFHLIFFNNDYWILDPAVDLMILMVPLDFFIQISIFIALLLLVKCAIIIVASTLYLRRLPRMTFSRL